MGVSIQNPVATFNNALVKNSKYLSVRALASQHAKTATDAENKVKSIMKEFSRDIHNGSTGGINVHI